MSVVTLTTDFGGADWFVGAMKGVLATLAPRARIVDITHETPPGDIHSAGFALAAACRYFPKRTVHVAVVDPGVGTSRPALAIRTRDYFFVGPDNGVLGPALARERIVSVRRITNTRLFVKPLSRTFHGRDVFAPVAARLSRGYPLGRVGPLAADFIRMDWPRPRRAGGMVEGRVLYIDRFGNAITNVDTAALPSPNAAGCDVWARGKRVGRVHATYRDVPAGAALAVVGSTGLLEIAIHGGSAADTLRLKVGDPVILRAGPVRNPNLRNRK